MFELTLAHLKGEIYTTGLGFLFDLSEVLSKVKLRNPRRLQRHKLRENVF